MNAREIDKTSDRNVIFASKESRFYEVEENFCCDFASVIVNIFQSFYLAVVLKLQLCEDYSKK